MYSIIILSELEIVWNELKNHNWPEKLLQRQTTVQQTDEGTIRTIKYRDGKELKQKLISQSEEDHSTIWENLPNGGKSSVKLIPITHSHQTLFVWESAVEDVKKESIDVCEYFRDMTAKHLAPRELGVDLYKYLLDHGTRENPVMTELKDKTSKHELATMMTAPDQINMFRVLLKAINAKKVIEVGVFTGYSALGMALALPEDGKLVACDVSEEFTNIGKPYWEKAGVSKKIDLRIGPATETLNALCDIPDEKKSYDFAYVDADKPNYQTYYEILLKLVRKGGLICIDNVLWGGNVIHLDVNDERTVAIRKLNDSLFKDDRIEIAMVPLGDGLTIAYVKD